MSSVSHSVSASATGPWQFLVAATRGSLDDCIGYAAVCCVVSSLVSIAAASFFLGLAILLWLIQGFWQGRVRFLAPAFGPWIAAYVSAIFISIIFSLDPWASAVYLLKLIKLSLPFLVFTFMTRSQVMRSLKVIFAVMSLSALVGVLQYLLWEEVTLLNRITGFMSHWMTFAGQLMLVLITLSSYLLFGVFLSRDKETQRSRGQVPLYLLVWGICVVALLLSYTRNAWLGCLVGAALLIISWDWRWILPALFALVLLFFWFPSSLQQRVYDGFRAEDRTMQGRIELIQTGVNMVRANPLTGVGPRMVPRSASSFRTRDDFPDQMYVHLHNSPLQIAAEFGLLTLAIWLAFWGYTLHSLWCLARESRNDPEARLLALNGVAVIVAFLCAGMLEFNFGDAEVIILLLFLITAPYVVAREPKTS